MHYREPLSGLFHSILQVLDVNYDPLASTGKDAEFSPTPTTDLRNISTSNSSLELQKLHVDVSLVHWNVSMMS